MRVKALQTEDADQYLKLMKTLDSETQFMLYEAYERKTTVLEMKEMIQFMNRNGSLLLGAFMGERLVGVLTMERGHALRIKHSAYIVAGVLKEFSGKGIGKRLFIESEVWARDKNITKLELTVMVHNKHAIGLYKKMGFEIEGIKRQSIKIEGHYMDEYYMGKVL